MTHPDHAVKMFADIGATLRVNHVPPRWMRNTTYRLDVRRDKGEYFSLTVTPATPDVAVNQRSREQRHLLLSVGPEQFLCGHDERHWFVATLQRRVSTIDAARRALLPTALLDRGFGVDTLRRRHGKDFVRQGEWFFVPTNMIFTEPKFIIHRNEPIQRGRRQRAHLVDEIVRFGGTQVVLYGGTEYSEAEWAAYSTANKINLRPNRMTKEAEVYARGRVRHPDHKTIVLPGWHRVYPNNEGGSVNMTFYD